MYHKFPAADIQKSLEKNRAATAADLDIGLHRYMLQMEEKKERKRNNLHK
jgi:hypothetical protein